MGCRILILDPSACHTLANKYRAGTVIDGPCHTANWDNDVLNILLRSGERGEKSKQMRSVLLKQGNAGDKLGGSESIAKWRNR